MHKRIKLFIAILALSTVACNNQPAGAPRKDGFSDKPATKADSLRHQVMEGHDIGMAKISRIRKSMAQINQQLDSLGKLPVRQQNQQYRQALISVQQALQNADEGMTTWMDEYKDDYALDNEALRIQYLEAEKEKVNTVKNRILESLARADSLLLKNH